MNLKFRSKKSWRYFPKRKHRTHRLRKICYAALILEVALIARDFNGAGIHLTEETLYKKVFLQKNQKEEEDDTVSQQHVGIQVRIKEGVIDFYRKEETYRVPEKNPGPQAD